jgi:predicted nucleic acid-binding protein
MKIYLDSCCYNRPFDDQSQDIIALESSAILSIINKCYSSENDVILGSDILDEEFSYMVDTIKKQKVLNLYKIIALKIKLNDYIKTRANEFFDSGIGSFDALHLASAEYAKADIFLTTDKKLISRSRQLNLDFKIMNPLTCIAEVLYEF